MQKNIAIIGANEAITMLINKAKELGYTTHVFAWQCGDPGEEAADFFYPISIDKKEEILDKCREIGVAGVCSITSDFAAPVVNYVARNLGLVCNPAETDELARNKYLMRTAFKEAGLYTPFFVLVGSDYNIEEFENMSFPVIVKPTDRWSSKGVTRVNSIEEIESAIKYAQKESFDNKAIIEGFMEGAEYSAECICFKGECHILAYTQKETTGYPHYIETGHVQPAIIPKELASNIEDSIKKAVKALHIENGAAHPEFKILPNGQVGIIEIGARMGGDCIGTDLTQLSTGIDYIRMVIDIACNNIPNFDIVTEPAKAYIKFIIDEKDLDTLNHIKNKEPWKLVKVSDISSELTGRVVDSSTRHGYYIIKEKN